MSLMTDARYAKSMLEVYGSDGDTLTNSAFVWSSLLKFNMISQSIGATGVVHYGSISHASLAIEDGSIATFSTDDLIKKSSWTKSFTTQDKSFSM
jgi:hypothetical protein